MTDEFVPPSLVLDAGRLASLDAYGVHELGAEAGFDGIVLLARTVCAAPVALVSFVGDDCQWFGARSGFGPIRTPLSQSVCAHALAEPGLLVVPDLTLDPRTQANTLVTGVENLRFYAGAPLRTPQGETLGTLCVLDTRARPAGLSEEQAEGLCSLAKQVMTQLELRRRLAALEHQLASVLPRGWPEPTALA